MCDQQSLRSACAYAQTDQSLCQSLEYFMIVKLLTEHYLKFLSIKGGCRGSSESTFVKMSNCWKSHALAQLCHSRRSWIMLWRHSNNKCGNYRNPDDYTKYLTVSKSRCKLVWPKYRNHCRKYYWWMPVYICEFYWSILVLSKIFVLQIKRIPKIWNGVKSILFAAKAGVITAKATLIWRHVGTSMHLPTIFLFCSNICTIQIPAPSLRTLHTFIVGDGGSTTFMK